MRTICHAKLNKMWRPAFILVSDLELPKNAKFVLVSLLYIIFGLTDSKKISGKVDKKLLRVSTQERWDQEKGPKAVLPKAKL